MGGSKYYISTAHHPPVSDIQGVLTLWKTLGTKLQQLISTKVYRSKRFLIIWRIIVVVYFQSFGYQLQILKKLLILSKITDTSYQYIFSRNFNPLRYIWLYSVWLVYEIIFRKLDLVDKIVTLCPHVFLYNTVWVFGLHNVCKFDFLQAYIQDECFVCHSYVISKKAQSSTISFEIFTR